LRSNDLDCTSISTSIEWLRAVTMLHDYCTYERSNS